MKRGLVYLWVALGVGILCTPQSAKADAFNVYVGYADNLRASGFFPTPWLGDTNVVSESGSAQTFDTGAIRIDNTGSSAITITNFTVTMYGATYSFWNSLVIAAGDTGIFTQTFSYNFDSSDTGVYGGAPPSNLDPNQGGNNGIGGCSSPAGFLTPAEQAACNSAIPVISFDENGNLVSFSDTGHILDTGGYDFVNLSSDGNESINWNSVGGIANRSGTVPEPTTITLLGAGIGVLAFARRRFKK